MVLAGSHPDVRIVDTEQTFIKVEEARALVVEAQARPLAVDLGAVPCPVQLWYGDADEVTPPAFGRWYADRLPHATLTVVEGAAHYLALTRWSEILAALTARAGA